MYFFFCLLIFTSHSCSSYYIFRFFPQLGGLKNFSSTFLCFPFSFFFSYEGWNFYITTAFQVMSFLNIQIKLPFDHLSISTSVLIKMWVLPQLWLWDLFSVDSFITEKNKIISLEIYRKKNPLKLSLLEFELGSHTKSSKPRASWSATCGTPQNISDSCLIVVCG